MKSRSYEQNTLNFWDVINLKQVAQHALNDWENQKENFRLVFGPVTVIAVLRELERFLEDDLK